DVLSGRTFSKTGAAGLTGTMPDNGAVTITPGTSAQAIPAGYHNGSGSVAGDAALIAGNIRGGAAIFGVAGSSVQASGMAVPIHVLSGVSFSNSVGASTGTMPDNGAMNYTPGTSNQAVASGYHNGSGVVYGDGNLTAANIRSGVSIFGTSGSAVEAGGDALAGDVLSGKTFSRSGASGLAGTMPNNGAVNFTPGISIQAVPAGYHNGSGVVAGDVNLTSGNIRSGVTIFGVAGDSNVVDTSSGDAVAGDIAIGKKAWAGGSEIPGTAYPAPVPITGQTPTVPFTAPAGSDGNLQKGMVWPNPRFTKNIDLNRNGDCIDGGETCDGTVTDNLTGLIWLKDADCMGQRTWSDALTQISSLNSGTDFTCDNYTAGTFSDWRLPNRFELESLLDLRYFNPPLPDTTGTEQWSSGSPFTGVQLNRYWSGSTYANDTTTAWCVGMPTGYVFNLNKTFNSCVWPVRGGQ
ncbi:MAG: DUF1566 domain-containing protein, partial [Gammaproteobacteria bacterium]|nr:DUF1566 domain-containing protein [Gammaproteobacteria bacterium]